MPQACLVFFLTIIILSVQDIYDQSITYPLLFPALLMHILSTSFNWSYFLLYLLVSLINILNHETWLGNGDIDITYLGFCYLGTPAMMISLLIASSTAMIWSMLLNQKRIAFVPFLTLGYLCQLF